MDEPVKLRIAQQLLEPRPLKGQTERQLAEYLARYELEPAAFLRDAAELLPDHELEILFAPQFTPTLDEQAALSDLLIDWRPTAQDVRRLTADLAAAGLCGVVLLPDQTQAPLTLHEVMIERHVKLLRLEQAPAAATVAQLQEILDDGQWPVAAALMRGRGMTAPRQAWTARFIAHLAARGPISRGMLVAVAEFIVEQPLLEPGALRAAAAGAVRAAESAAAFVQGGRRYWSPDVAQHHQYRGQGQVDQALAEQRQAEAQWLATVESALADFEDGA